ncbi:MAG TPA: right-handed parallel beta-helix repeat-containing protein [bacterium]|nr:right-handed parallel beta-helix repeat-containing protein [bacterium]
MKKSRFIVVLAFLATLTLGASGCVIEDDGCFDNCCFGCNPEIFTIQQAIDFALPGDTVFIENGVYSPSTNGEFFPIFMRNDVSVIGQDPENTILDAEGTGYVLDFFNYNVGTVANFTVIGGLSNLGGGIYAESSSGNIQNMIVTGNRASEAGTGVYVVTSSGLTITNTIVVGNSGTPDAIDDPAQVDLDASNIAFINNVVANGDTDGVRLNFGSTGTFENNIFFDNGSDAFGVGLADNAVESAANILYNITFGNAEGDYFLNGFIMTASEANDFFPDDQIANNFSADPLFNNPAVGDFTLQFGSPAIQAGDPNPVFDNPDGSRNDIGAFGGPGADGP